MYRITSLMRSNPLLGPYSRTIHRVLGGSQGGGHFHVSEVPLQVSPWELRTTLGWSAPGLRVSQKFSRGTDSGRVYTGALLMRNSAPLEPYTRTMPRALWWSQGGVLFLMSEVPLYTSGVKPVDRDVGPQLLGRSVCGYSPL